MKTIRIEDYLNETAPKAYVACKPEDEDRLREAAMYCCFTAVELSGEQFLSPRDIRDLLGSHYDFEAADTGAGEIELDISMEYKRYEIMGRPTVALSQVRTRHAATHPRVKADIERRFSATVGRG
ncbi:hypothetical protein OIU34_19925 [Pararhizobium sp. BT-229]|uniref:hypothetical protein n=1 Tax=Pararhizobium sp. BT-229 TaxID=2986923 RepID=UPI0021F6B1FC|nr:hypothetical protein [Pararhizobium sp. BT-229]MCV9964155.1 hypothetical protein [Pararhizobium sp. BT-229]